jgi:hypothetical protein
MRLRVVPGNFAICRMDATDPVPEWALASHDFVSITRTSDELSIVCPDAIVPPDIRAEHDWSAVKVQGPLPFSMTGVLNSIASPLAEARISLFAIATFDTDYVLVKSNVLEEALRVLTEAGHEVIR